MKRLFLILAFALASIALVAYATSHSAQDREELSRITELLDIGPGSVVADVGAGDGKWAVALADAVGPEGRIYATEVDSSDLKKIRDRVEREAAANVTVVEGNQTDTGLASGCCDAILLRRVYHHFQDPRPMRLSLRDALRPNGKILMIDFEARRRWRRPSGIPESRDGHGIDRSMIIEEMESDGFELVSQHDWANRDYALVFRVAVID